MVVLLNVKFVCSCSCSVVCGIIGGVFVCGVYV